MLEDNVFASIKIAMNENVLFEPHLEWIYW